MIARKRRRGDWDHGSWNLNDQHAAMWHAQHPFEKLVQRSDGRWVHLGFNEKVYYTELGTRYRKSTIKKRDDLGLFRIDGVAYIWKLSKDCQDIQLYEAHMEKNIRHYHYVELEERQQTG